MVKYYNADGTSARSWDKASGATLYAGWTPNAYVVTLDKQSGTGGTDSVTATYGSAMPSATMPTRTGYTFGGYYTTIVPSQGVQYYNSNGTSARAWNVSEDRTLYAKWTAKTMTVTLDRQGGTGGTSSVTATYGSPLPGGISVPTRTGYNFGGYYAQTGGGGQQYYSSVGYSGSEWAWTGTANGTIYAKWSPKQCTVTLDRQGGTGGSASVTATYGSAMPSITVPTRQGYTFGGYYTAANGGGTRYYKADGTSAKVSDILSGVTLYAKWTAKTYKLVVDPNGGKYRGQEGTYTYPDDDSAHQQLTTGSSDLSLLFVPQLTGHAFVGFYAGGERVYGVNDSNDGAPAVAGTYWTAPYVGYQNRGNFKGLADASATSLTVQALWSQLRYVKVVDADGQEIPLSVATVSYSPDTNHTSGGHKAWAHGQSVTITVTPAAGVRVTRYDIKSDPDGTDMGGGSVPAGETSAQISLPSLTSDAEVRVSFGVVQHQVSFALDSASAGAGSVSAESGGTPVATGASVDHGTTVAFVAEAATGFGFDGWYENGTRVTANATYERGVDGDVSLVAKFSAEVVFGLESVGGASATLSVNGAAVEAPHAIAVALGDSVRYAVATGNYFDAWYKSDVLVGSMGQSGTLVVTEAAEYVAKVQADAVTRNLTVYAVLKTIVDDAAVYDGLTVSGGRFVTVEGVTAVTVEGVTAVTATEGVGTSAQVVGDVPDDDDPDPEGGSNEPFSSDRTIYVMAEAESNVRYGTGEALSEAYFDGWAVEFDSGQPAEVVSRDGIIQLLLNQEQQKLYAIYGTSASEVTVSVAYAAGSDDAMGQIGIVGGTGTGGRTRTAYQGTELTLLAVAAAGYRFAGWYRRDVPVGDPVYASGSAVITAGSNATYYACFTEDRDSILEWEGSSENKTAEWRSKTYALPRPVNPSAVRVDSLGYRHAKVLDVKVDMFSSPDAEPTRSAELENVESQTVRRLPMMRPERYMQVAVENNEEIDAVFVGTSAGGLAV